MTEMKLGKLPDRTPAKHTITVPPALNKRLQDYTAMYNEEHKASEPEELSELIPYMLEAFLDSDRAFARRAKLQKRNVTNETPVQAQGRRRPNGANSQTNV